jgi:hypothetical protein
VEVLLAEGTAGSTRSPGASAGAEVQAEATSAQATTAAR